MVDDSHAVGFVGAKGRGTPEHCGVMGRVDILTGTLGKALGGASGGYTSGRKEIVDWLRQRSPPVPVLQHADAGHLRRHADASSTCSREATSSASSSRANAELLPERDDEAGLQARRADHPIIPVMLGDAKLATSMADQLLDEGIYVIGFSYPVVPQGQARIRTQMSAAHTREQLDRAIAAFAKVGRALGVIR